MSKWMNKYAGQIRGRIASQWVNGNKTSGSFMKGKMESLNKACPKQLGNLHCQLIVYQSKQSGQTATMGSVRLLACRV